MGNSTYAQSSEKTPDSVLKGFYQWYIRAVDDGTYKKGNPTMKKFVTIRLMQQIARDEARGLDADSFVQTQEWDAEWANNVKVSNLSINGAKATAIVTFGNDNYPRIAVTLVKAAGTWKIDRVKDAVLEVPSSSPDPLWNRRSSEPSLNRFWLSKIFALNADVCVISNRSHA